MKKNPPIATLFLSLLCMLALLFTSCSPFYSGLLEGGESATQAQSQTQESATETESESESETASESESTTDTDEKPDDGETALPDAEQGTVNLAGASARAFRSVAMAIACFSVESGSSLAHYAYGTAVMYRLLDNGGAFFVTNYHLVYDSYATSTTNTTSSEIYLYLYGKTLAEYAISATFVGGSATYDIAVLYVPPCDVLTEAVSNGTLVPVTVADSDKIYPGDTTLAVGCPTDEDIAGFSVTRGIVSVESEYITMAAIDTNAAITMRVIRTDSAVNSGNSGGGLFNDQGEMIGIVNAKSTVDDFDGIGYAIPSNVVRAISDNIIDFCYEKDCTSVMRCILGITVTTGSQKTVYDEESGRLVYIEDIEVTEVSRGMLADGKFLAGDVIKQITVAGKTVTVTRQHHVIDAMMDARPGDDVTVLVRRGEKDVTITLKITEDCLTAY